MSFGIKSSTNAEASRQAQVEKSQRKMASGERINSAGDDAASFAVAVFMEGKERSLGVAGRNAQDAVGRLQTAEGALAGQQEGLSRLRELAIQSANGSLSPNDRQAIQTEANATVAEIDRIGKETRFNDEALLASTSTKQFQVGTSADAKDRIQVTLNASTAQTLGVAGLDLSSPGAAGAALDAIDGASTRVSQSRVDIGASQTRLRSAFATAEVARESVTRSRSLLQDTDVAAESAELASGQIRAQAEVAVMAQFNAQKSSMLKLLA